MCSWCGSDELIARMSSTLDFLSASRAAPWTACHGVRSHAEAVALGQKASLEGGRAPGPAARGA